MVCIPIFRNAAPSKRTKGNKQSNYNKLSRKIGPKCNVEVPNDLKLISGKPIGTYLIFVFRVIRPVTG